MTCLRAGSLKKSVKIQSAVLTKNTTGELIPAWSTDATVRASIKQASGDETVDENQQKTTKTFDVVIRYFAGLTAANRLLWGVRVLNIASVDNVDEADVEMRLICKEAV